MRNDTPEHVEVCEILQSICPYCDICWEIEPEWMSFRCSFCGKIVQVQSEGGGKVNLS